MLMFRNVDVDVDASIATWPTEAVLTLVERGMLADWRRLVAEIRSDPWGQAAAKLETVLGYADSYGVVPLLGEILRDARVHADREEVVTRLRGIRERSGMTIGEFAEFVGTSRTRMSTYLSGKVMPSAAVLVRAERVAAQIDFDALRRQGFAPGVETIGAGKSTGSAMSEPSDQEECAIRDSNPEPSD